MLLALCKGNSPVTGEIPSLRLVTRSFDVFFDLRRNKRLRKPSRCRLFETPSRHYDVTVMSFVWETDRWILLTWNPVKACPRHIIMIKFAKFGSNKS